MRAKADILERLVDFERHGNTAIERFTMRMDAHAEIKRLRTELRSLNYRSITEGEESPLK